MRLANTLSWALLGTLGACQPTATPEGDPAECIARNELVQPDAQHPLSEPLQAALEDAIDAGLPGVVMAIRDRDGIWEGAAGSVDLGRGEPMQTCHRTRIASVTKTFIATAILALAEQGRLDLTAPISNYLPSDIKAPPNADEITVEQLLNHTSGVYNFLDVALVLELFNRPDRTWSTAEAYDHALDHDPEFSPGARWSYSNTNYILLGWILEGVTGQSQNRVLREQIFEPLNMVETDYRVDSFDFAGVAHGYFDLMGDRTLVDSTQSYANVCIGGDGGMVSSARDILTFFDHLFAQGDLLSPDSVERMLPRVETNEEDFPLYGLGIEAWGEEGPRRGIGHGGQEFGYRTFAYYFPERDLTFVVWVNASSLIPTDDNIAAVINAQRNRLRDIALRL